MAGKSKLYNHVPFRHYGNAIMFWYDETRSTWDGIGLIENPRYTPNTTKQKKTQYAEGQRVTAASRTQEQMATLEFDWLEHLNPRGNQRIYGDKTSTQTIYPANVAYIDYELELYRNDATGDAYEQFAPFAVAQANYTRLGAPATFLATVSAAGTGSSWSTGGSPDYYSWCVPVHDLTGEGAPDKATICDSDRLDVKYVFGKPWDEAGLGAYTGEPVDFTNATDIVTFTGTASADMMSGKAPTPDYVAVFMNTTNDLSTARVVAIGTWASFIGAGLVALTYDSQDVFEHSVHATFWADAGTYDTPSLSLLDMDGTDITWDNTRAAMKLGSDYTTSDSNGVTVKMRQAYVESPRIRQTLGPTGVGNDYRKVMIVCLDNQEDGPIANLYAEGDVVVLYRVDCAGIESQLSWSEDDWNAPVSVTAELISDPSNGNDYGYKALWSPALRSLATQLYR